MRLRRVLVWASMMAAYCAVVCSGTPVKVVMESAPCAVDWNGDGVLDLLVGDDRGYVSLFLGVEQGSLLFRVPYLLRTEGKGMPLKVVEESRPDVCDWNGDGLIDLVVGDGSGGVSVFLRHDAPGLSLLDGTPVRMMNGEWLRVHSEAHPTCADWNGDGLEDLVVGTLSDDIYVFVNRGSNSDRMFDAGVKVRAVGGEAFDFPNATIAPWFADWDGDGLGDLIVGYSIWGASEGDCCRGYVYFYRNVGTETEPRFASQEHVTHGGGTHIDVEDSAAPCIVDWSGDGLLDLIVGSESGLVHFFRRTGPGSMLTYMGTGSIVR